MADAAGYGPDLPETNETINVTAPDPGGVTSITYDPIDNFDLGMTGPGAMNDPFGDFVIGGDIGELDLTTNPGTGVFGEEAEKARREKLKKALKLLLTTPGLSTDFLALLASSLGIQDFGDPVSFNPGGAQQAAQLLGIPTLPTPNPGATQSVSFLDWQPDNPMSNPESRMVDHQVYRPDKVPPPAGLLQALLDQLAAGLGNGADGSVGGITPRLGPGQSGFKITPPSRNLGGGRSGGGTALY